MKNKIDLILYAGGYKYPFFNGVMRFFDIHQDKFEINSITGTSSAAFCSAMHASGYTSDHHIRDLILNISKDKILEYKRKGFKKIYKINSDAFRIFINLEAIKNKPYDVNVCVQNNKTKEVIIKNLKDCETRSEAVDYITAAHTIPGVTDFTLGCEEHGYLINSVSVGLDAWGVLRDSQNVKVVVFQTNPHEAPQKEIKLFSQLTADNIIPLDTEYQKSLLRKNKDCIFIYPEGNIQSIENDEIGGFSDFYEGFKTAKASLKVFLQKVNET